MSRSRLTQLIVILIVLAVSFAGAENAYASSSCGSTYYVQWGDTLSGIAQLCGTSMEAIRAANPGLWYWVFAGQTLIIPSTPAPAPAPAPAPSPQPGRQYIVQRGDTLFSIAMRFGTSVNAILVQNPQILNPGVIYAGQVITVPSAPVYYTIQRGDTLRIIANRYGTSVYNLQLLNPQIWNPNWIYAGQVIRVW